jgi:hypothetical protein
VDEIYNLACPASPIPYCVLLNRARRVSGAELVNHKRVAHLVLQPHVGLRPVRAHEGSVIALAQSTLVVRCARDVGCASRGGGCVWSLHRGFAVAPATLMRALGIVFRDPCIEINLQPVGRAVDLAERRAIELV